ncbi:hypothetical protein EMA8858_03224 [Emticicia aquatica]|uniref:Heparan-alpha-glucosaminide N-acetyltransferase catalytic domain-containing protein n=1 Tax=Emticicia aquatica TaxID=1681835 RepID=A0ABM9ATS3_9BACT|nr:heparan-alpha-glucosaminide N-acetyltransferase domain-containing protein [Emticicia aquatica]CAH0997087.1 hypothetical protein EMA8858_03224 [Emticicia aquatica]
MKRITSIDVVRGIVMLIMALDHTRDFLLQNALTQNPTDLSNTYPALFFTRWITHLCAPTFVFLSGVSAYISAKRQNNINESRKFLLTRGIWLIFLEFSIVSFGIWSDIGFHTLLFQVIAAIGVGFLLLSLLVGKSHKIALGIGSFIMVFYGLFALVPESGLRNTLSPLFVLTVLPLGERLLILAYPILPWWSIMLLGYGLGEYFLVEKPNRIRFFMKMAGGFLIAFVVLRLINIYGDPVAWSVQTKPFFTFLSFINVSKNAPSLDFTLCMLGIAFALLWLTEMYGADKLKFFKVFGSVPLFYYLIHWYVIRTFLIVIFLTKGYHWGDFVFNEQTLGRPKNDDGITLPQVYLAWFNVILIMYPISKWYSNYKSQHPEKTWLRYL